MNAAPDTPTLNAHSKTKYPVTKQSSFGSVVYDSNRKTRESVAAGGSHEDHRAKQASSLSPSRMI